MLIDIVSTEAGKCLQHPSVPQGQMKNGSERAFQWGLQETMSLCLLGEGLYVTLQSWVEDSKMTKYWSRQRTGCKSKSRNIHMNEFAYGN